MVLIPEPLIFLRTALLRAAVVVLGSLIPEKKMGFSLPTGRPAFPLKVFSASAILARRILVRERTFTCTGWSSFLFSGRKSAD